MSHDPLKQYAMKEARHENLPPYESIYVNCLTKSAEIHRLVISKELSVTLGFPSRVIKNALELHTIDGYATHTAFVLSFIYLSVHSLLYICSFLIIHSLMYCMCGDIVHGYRDQKKLLIVLCCSPQISLRQNLSLKLMFFDFLN